jgi:hypothetical protein
MLEEAAIHAAAFGHPVWKTLWKTTEKRRLGRPAGIVCARARHKKLFLYLADCRLFIEKLPL